MSKREPEVPGVPGAYESRAFFAALLAACRNQDDVAAAILRDIADHMTEEFKPKAEG